MTDDTTMTAEAALDQASQPFVGQWHRLVSMTNWDKGRIISEWRGALVAKEVPSREYSDDAWCRRIGGVSSQHVGRLRRVYRRFGEVHTDYDGLYWSHFYAALEWNDAEMWLEGGVQQRWSVAQMRRERWQALGSPPDQEPRDEEIAIAPPDDEDGPPYEEVPGAISASVAEVHDPGAERPAGQQPSDGATRDVDRSGDGPERDDSVAAETSRMRPFEDLGDLPDDLADALETLKLAILAHKHADWAEVASDDVLRYLDALKQLIEAPAGD